jgi:hypothetical protein
MGKRGEEKSFCFYLERSKIMGKPMFALVGVRVYTLVIRLSRIKSCLWSVYLSFCFCLEH